MKFNDNTSFHVGQILVEHFGYSMVIPKFWKVTGLKGKKSLNLVAMTRIDANTHKACGWQGRCIPGSEDPNKTIVARISKYGYLSIDGHYATPWDGNSELYDFMD